MRGKLAKFGDDIITIAGVMTLIQISVNNFGIALKLCKLSYFIAMIICTNFVSFYRVDRELQKYRHLQMSFTYDAIDVSLRRSINDMVLKIL